MPDLKDIKLPSLADGVKLSEAGSGIDGAPRWRLYHAPAHKYYQLGWSEFECLARFQFCTTAQELKEKVEAETSLMISPEDIHALLAFLSKNGLVASADTQAQEYTPRKTMPLWKKMVHSYLFFTIPLFKPERFLRRSFPVVRPLLSAALFRFMMLVLALAAIFTLGRVDEFTHTFFGFLSLEGAILIGVSFFVIKILHELAHAYTAHKHGVNVPHMGLAFMVMYPVLYTETTQAWRLSSKEARMEIGLAGIRIELMLAALALALWTILPAGGAAQSIAFGVVAISLVGSLLINLNPLMRFDGYFVLSDYLGIENLHAQGFANARWWIRRTLFGLDDAPPENHEKRRHFLIGFGLATLIYRFFLFLGIALLVYHIFFKPLGLILMVIELLWFIILPVLSELKIWWARRAEIIRTHRGKAIVLMSAILLAFLVLPVSTTTSAPAMLHHAEMREIYPPAPSIIEDILITDHQNVVAGTPLMRLSSPSLEKDIALSRARLEQLQAEKKQLLSNPALAKERLALIDSELKAEGRKLDMLKVRQANLIITAPFEGVIRDLDHTLYKGQVVGMDHMLLRLINPDKIEVSAYVTQNDLRRIAEGNMAVFRQTGQWSASIALTLQSIDRVNVQSLDWPALSSVYGGPIPSESGNLNGLEGQKAIIPRQSLYKIRLQPMMQPSPVAAHSALAKTGSVSIASRRNAPISRFMHTVISTMKQESGLN